MILISKFKKFLKKFKLPRSLLIKIYYIYREPEIDFSIVKKLKLNTAIDVGANVGFYTNVFSKISSKVIAFEPIDSLAELLKKNFKKKNHINIFSFALGEFDEEKLFFVPEGNEGEASFINRTVNSKQLRTKVKRGDDVLEGIEDIDLIKIDVEGYELNVLKGLKNLIMINYPIFLIEIEKRHNKYFNDVFLFLQEYEYDVYYMPARLKLKKIQQSNYSNFVDNYQAIENLNKEMKIFNYKNFYVNKQYINNFWFLNRKSKIISQLNYYKVD